MGLKFGHSVNAIIGSKSVKNILHHINKLHTFEFTIKDCIRFIFGHQDDNICKREIGILKSHFSYSESRNKLTLARFQVLHVAIPANL